MTLAIAHREGTAVVLDLLRERKPPFAPREVAEEFSITLWNYWLRTVYGDAYGGQWPREQFAAHGIEYRVADKARTELYLSMLPRINSVSVELLDNRRLVQQLVNLERRMARSGRESVDHPSGQHDDVANAAAGAIELAGAFAMRPTLYFAGIERGIA